MGTAAKWTRENRTITVDFRDDATYVQLLGDGKAFVDFCVRFPPRPWLSARTQGHLSRGWVSHPPLALCPPPCVGSPSGVSSARRVKRCAPCCRTSVLRYRQIRPEVARDALACRTMEASVWSCAPCSPISPPWRSTASSVRLATRSGASADPVWVAAAGLVPGRRKA